MAHAIVRGFNRSLIYESKHSAFFFLCIQLFNSSFKSPQNFNLYFFFFGFQSFSGVLNSREISLFKKISVLETKIIINTSILRGFKTFAKWLKTEKKEKKKIQVSHMKDLLTSLTRENVIYH